MADPADMYPDPGACEACAEVQAKGRSEGDPIHCKDCHQSWTGTEAQHCMVCHRTFKNIKWADAHRYHKGGEKCWDVSKRPDWRECRPGVWTSGEVMADG